MLQLRSKRLLTGASALALLTSFGVVNPVLADVTVSGPGLKPPIVNTGSETFINIDLGAVVEEDDPTAAVGDSIFNSGTITNGTQDGINIDDSVLLGNITNTGTINATGAFNGIGIVNDTVLVGGIFNSGSIVGGTNGIFIDGGEGVSVGVAGISNTAGLIQGGAAGAGIQIGAGAVFVGGISNAATITGGRGIQMSDLGAVFVGGITNSGTITGTAAGGAGIELEMQTFEGGIANTGTIAGTATGSGIRIIEGEFIGGIDNGSSINSTAAITATGGVAAIWFEGKNASTFDGGIDNWGSIVGSTGANGFQMNAGVFTGGITNHTTGTIAALGLADVAVSILGGTFDGGITNQGKIQANGLDATAVNIAGATDFDGGITNSGTIEATAGTAVAIATTVSFGGGITNTGSIVATSDAVRITAAAFSGGIVNNNGGRIDAYNGNAIEFSGTGAFSGDIVNQSGGVIEAGYDVVTIGGASFTGSLTNAGTIDNTWEGTGVVISSTTWTGSLTNSGYIDGETGDGVVVNVTTHTGGFTNNGTIIGGDDGVVYLAGTQTGGNFSNTKTIIGSTGVGVTIDGTTLAANISNSGTGYIYGAVVGVDLTATSVGAFDNDGTISSSGDGVIVEGGTTVNGDFRNDGTIFAGSDAGDIGIDIGGSITGQLVNTGVIDPYTGIAVSGHVAGGITSSGTILADFIGINLTNATGAHTITQSGGLIRANEDGTIFAAIDMSNTTHADDFFGTGGVLDGNIDADAIDNLTFDPATLFVWQRGTAQPLSDVSIGGEGGWTIFGATARGDAGGEGVTVTSTATMTNEGRLYLDDDSTINVTGAFTGGNGLVEFYLTSDELVHGQINAATLTGLTAGNIQAYVNGATFGSVGGDTFLYEDVFTGTTNGTTDDIETNSLFFLAQAIFNPGSVDIQLTRQDFADALVLPGMTQNQASIAATLDEIYDLGPDGSGGDDYGPDFEDFFNYLLSLPAGSEDVVLALYDEIAGREYAQLQQTTLDILSPFNLSITERLDAAKTSLGGTQLAERDQRYAQSSLVMSDASHGLVRGPSSASIWARGYGQWLDVEGDLEAPGYDQSTGGFAAGLDFAIDSNAFAGLSVGFSSTDVNFDTPGDDADVDSLQFGLYGSYGFGHFYADAIASAAFHDLSTNRFLNLPSPPGGMVAGANYDSRALSLSGEIGAVLGSGKFKVQPFAGLAFTDVETDGFIEAGGGDFSLIVDDSSAQSFASSLGLRASTLFKSGGMTIVPDIKAAWRHEFDDDRQSITAAFPDDPTSPFTIISSPISEDSAVIGAGLTAGVAKGLEIFIDYNGLINSDVDVHNGSGGIRFTW